jgi:hypothetical protein
MLEVLADEVLSLADDVANAENPVAVAAARLQVDSRKWLLSKLKPKQYGDRLELAGQVDIAVDPGAVLLKRRQERLAAKGQVDIQRVLAEGE